MIKQIYLATFLIASLCNFKVTLAQTAWTQINAGFLSSAGIKNDGSLWAWGDNGSYQLSNGTTTNSPTPILLSQGSTWLKASANNSNIYAIKSDGTLWGAGDYTFITIGGEFPVKNFSQMDTSNRWIDISGGNEFTAALKVDGSVWVTGSNYYNQLAGGRENNRINRFSKSTVIDMAKIDAGAYHCLGIKKDGTLWGWGRNDDGAIGDNTIINHSRATQVGSENNWSEISAGFEYSLALKNDGTLWGWGKNTYYQLGTGDKEPRYVPIRLSNDKWKTFSAGEFISAGVKADGTLWIWGFNNKIPVQVGSETTWTQISSGPTHALALRSNFTGYCAQGSNSYGQLGRGDFTREDYEMFCVDIITSVNSRMEDGSTQIYPNPNLGNFSFKATLPGTYILLNELGQVVRKMQVIIAGTTQEIENLSPGVYTIQGEALARPLRVVVVR